MIVGRGQERERGEGAQIFTTCHGMATGDGKMKKASEENRVTFEHVAGLDGAKEELQEIVHFLKEPERYTQVKKSPVIGEKEPCDMLERAL